MRCNVLEEIRRDNALFSAAVDFDVYAAEADWAVGKEWPPRRFSARDGRFDTLSKLWRGEYHDFVAARGRWIVGVNPFRSYSTKLANFLALTSPELPALADSCLYDAIIDMSRYGGAVLRQIDGVWQAEEPAGWYPVADGTDLFVRRYISASASQAVPDRVSFEHLGVRRVHDLSGNGATGVVGRLLAEESISFGGVEVVANPPAQGQLWGSTVYLEAAPMAVEIATRLSRNSRVLDLYGSPVAQFRMSNADAIARFAEGSTDADEIERRIDEGLEADIERNPYRIKDDTGGLELVQPQTPGVSHSLEQVEVLSRQIERELGMPMLDEAGEVHSGRALQQLFVHFYAETSSIQNQISRALGIDWPHPFDSDFFDNDQVEPARPTQMEVLLNEGAR